MYIYNLTVPNDVKRKFASQNNIFMEHDLNILMIFGITEKCIILTDTMYFWLRDYVTRHVHKLVKCNVRLLILQHNMFSKIISVIKTVKNCSNDRSKAILYLWSIFFPNGSAFD